jgi:hypothetical protein
MRKKNTRYTPVLLNLENDDLEKVDSAANRLDVSRTQFLRQSVIRNLSHFETKELPFLGRFKGTFDEVLSNA